MSDATPLYTLPALVVVQLELECWHQPAETFAQALEVKLGDETDETRDLTPGRPTCPSQRKSIQ